MKMFSQLIAPGDKHGWIQDRSDKKVKVYSFINIPEGFAFKKINPNAEIFNHKAIRIDLKRLKKVI